MIIFFRKREKHIEDKEKEIQATKEELHKSIDKDLKTVNKLNKVLSNGITLQIKKAMEHDHAK